MEDDMILLENIMPVEIAIRRELEYRKKMEALSKHMQYDIRNDYIPIQEPLANITGVKRKAPPPPPTLSLGGSGIGGSSLSLPPLSLSTHHQDFRKQPAGLMCTTCEEEFSTLHYLKRHCSSQAHKDKQLKLRNSGRNIGNHLWCKLCNAPGSSAIVLEQHLQGIKHAAALKTLEISGSGERNGGAGWSNS